MRILLIGATGQIGYTLTNALSRTPHDLVILARDAHKLPFPANMQVREAGIFTPEAFEAALHDADAVIYGLGLPLQPTLDKLVWQRVNYDLFQTFLQVLKRSPVRRLIYVSSEGVLKPDHGRVCETNSLVDPEIAPPYCLAMLRAYQMVQRWAAETDTLLTTIHPVTVYGGLNTGLGVTDYIENLLNHRSANVPIIIDTRLPVVHAESLAAAIILALDKAGAFVVSDQMVSLKEIALILHSLTGAYVPPVDAARGLCSEAEPDTGHSQEVLGWQPMTFDAGVHKYLQDRAHLLACLGQQSQLHGNPQPGDLLRAPSG